MNKVPEGQHEPDTALKHVHKEAFHLYKQKCLWKCSYVPNISREPSSVLLNNVTNNVILTLRSGVLVINSVSPFPQT